MARPERFERPTAWFVARYSIQLSYGRVEVAHYTDLREISKENKKIWRRERDSNPRWSY